MSTNVLVNILVVEDTRVYRKSFCELLQSCFPHARIMSAADATTALGMTRQTRFDLIIADYHLNALNGGDIVRHLRRRATQTDTTMPRVVIMSTQPDVAVFARAMGAHAFLSKPALVEDIAAVIEPLLQHLEPASEKSIVVGQATTQAAPGERQTEAKRPLLWRVQPRNG